MRTLLRSRAADPYRHQLVWFEICAGQARRSKFECLRSAGFLRLLDVVDLEREIVPPERHADPIETRPGFAAMLERIESNGVRTIIVETANRFARDLMVQEVGYARLRERGINLIAADSPNAFQDDTPTAKLVRQVLGAIAEFDKAMTVAKLRARASECAKQSGNVKAENPLLRCIRPWCARRSVLAGLAPRQESGVRCARSRPNSPKSGKRSPLPACQVPRKRPGRISHAIVSTTAPRASGQC